MIQPVLGQSQMAHHWLVHLHMQRNRYRQYVHYNNKVCIAHVDDPDSAGSFANGPSLIGASTYAVGTDNNSIVLNSSKFGKNPIYLIKSNKQFE